MNLKSSSSMRFPDKSREIYISCKHYQIQRVLEYLGKIPGLDKFHTDDFFLVVVILALCGFYFQVNNVAEVLEDLIDLYIVGVYFHFQVENPWVDYLYAFEDVLTCFALGLGNHYLSMISSLRSYATGTFRGRQSCSWNRDLKGGLSWMYACCVDSRLSSTFPGWCEGLWLARFPGNHCSSRLTFKWSLFSYIGTVSFTRSVKPFSYG